MRLLRSQMRSLPRDGYVLLHRFACDGEGDHTTDDRMTEAALPRQRGKADSGPLGWLLALRVLLGDDVPFAFLGDALRLLCGGVWLRVVAARLLRSAEATAQSVVALLVAPANLSLRVAVASARVPPTASVRPSVSVASPPAGTRSARRCRQRKKTENNATIRTNRWPPRLRPTSLPPLRPRCRPML